MLSPRSSYMFSSLILAICVTNVVTQDMNITIPLNKTTIFRDKQLYGDFITLNRTSSLQVDFNEIRENLSFVIIQVHSHLYNVTLYKNVRLNHTLLKGTNIGLHSENLFMKTDKFYVENLHSIDLKLYIAVHGYFDYDPLPGGCNNEFPPVPVTPFMRAIHNRNYIYVNAAPARRPDDEDCEFPEEISLTFYMMYLPAQNFDSDVYFDGIIDMMSLKNLRNKKKIPRTEWNNQRMLSAYTGTGAVFVVVAKPIDNGIVNETCYSVYVPVTTYGCLPLLDDCDLLDNALSQFACAVLFFIGIFVCFYGHRFFKTNTFFIGFLSGIVITYLLVSLIKNEMNTSAILAISVFSGLCVGAVRVVYWWIYGLPVFSIILSSADVGFMISSLLFYSIPDDYWVRPFYLNLDINFWTLFILTIALITIVLVLASNVSNLICCAVIGGYATVLPIDYYLNTHLKYILIYIMRRATVHGFYKAVKMTTYQWKDGMLMCFWICLSIGGFVFQKHQNRGRPPFPPPPRSVRAIPEGPASIAGPSRLSGSDSVDSVPYRFSERTPLLS